MPKFVNYKKRSVALPPGCKDLLDVLEPSRRSKPEPGGWQTTFVETDRLQTEGLAHIGEYISKLLQCGADFFTVMIYHPDYLVPVVLLRNRSDNVFAVALYDNEPQAQRAIKAFFLQQGIEPLRDCSVPAAGGISSLIYLLPLDHPKATALVTGLLRTAYGLSDEAGLDFRYYAVGKGS